MFKSYAHKSDAVRSFKKLFGAEAYSPEKIQEIDGRFQFQTEDEIMENQVVETAVETTIADDMLAINFLPAEVIDQVSTRHLAQRVLMLHPGNTFPGREKRINGWIELENGRGIAVNVNPKTGEMKAITVVLPR